MDGRTILFASIVGALTGITSTLMLGTGEPTMCCLDVVLLASMTLIGSTFAVRLFSRVPTTGATLLAGAIHGVCIGGLAAITTWIVISLMTSDETVETRALEFIDRNIAMFEQLPEEQRSAEIDDYREPLEDLREEIPGNPQFVRSAVYAMMFMYALVIAPLIGLIGGWLGLAIFGRGIEARAQADDPDRQENDWWSDYSD